ncbi:MAG: ATP-binding protein [Christensenellaceae bacterium]|nr:ATP-binding protein [Christensenellaceae bacterium]
MTLYDILSEYDARKNRAEALAEQRKKEVYGRSALLGQLEDERKEILLKQLRDVMRRPAEKQAIVEQASAKVAALDAHIEAAMQQAGVTQSDLAVRYTCELCKDTGYIPAQNGKKQLCPCLKEQLYLRVYGAEDIAALEGSFEAFDSGVFTTQEARSQMENIRAVVENYADAYPNCPKTNLVFMGNCGIGKSFLLSAVAKRLKEKESDVVYIRAAQLFSLFHAHRLGQGPRLDTLLEAKVLLIDDLGTEPMTQNVTVEYFFDLLERRGAAGLPILIATNLSKNQVKERYTERIYSRLFSKKTTGNFIFPEPTDLRMQ